MNQRKKIFILSTLGLVCAAAQADDDLLQSRSIGLGAAQEAVAAAVAACSARGLFVSAAVVDRAGQLVALNRADGAGPHTPESARRKAYTSASLRNSTNAILRNTQTNPAAANLVWIPEFLVLGGGLPIRAGNQVVGGIGVGGAPSGDIDEQCAQAGIESLSGKFN
jgi:uncharacterized protein GlcG (DUF336 family)